MSDIAATTPDVLEDLRASELDGQESLDDPFGQGAPEATPQQPEPPQDLILGKFRSQDDFVRSYTELEQRLGAQANEIGQLRQAVAQTQQQYQQPQQQAQPVQPQVGYSNAELEELRVTDPARYFDTIMPLMMQAYGAELSSRFEQMLAPVLDVTQETSVHNVTSRLRAELGDEFVQRYGNQAVEMISADPSYFQNGAQIAYDRVKMALQAKAYEDNYQTQTQAVVPVTEQVTRTAHVEGGSTGHNPQGAQSSEPADPILAAWDSQGTPRDRFGGTPAGMPLLSQLRPRG